MSGKSAVEMVESNLIHGGARWIADLTEFFKDYRIDDTVFAIYAKGNTRNRGLLLSRFLAWTVLPNYLVSLFCVDEGDGLLTTDKLRKRIDTVISVLKREGLKWAWVIVLSNRDLPAQVVSFVSRYDHKEVGLAIASTLSSQVVLSANQLGRSIGKQFCLRKTLERISSRKN